MSSCESISSFANTAKIRWDPLLFYEIISCARYNLIHFGYLHCRMRFKREIIRRDRAGVSGRIGARKLNTSQPNISNPMCTHLYWHRNKVKRIKHINVLCVVYFISLSLFQMIRIHHWIEPNDIESLFTKLETESFSFWLTHKLVCISTKWQIYQSMPQARLSQPYSAPFLFLRRCQKDCRERKEKKSHTAFSWDVGSSQQPKWNDYVLLCRRSLSSIHDLRLFRAQFHLRSNKMT